MGRNDGNPSGVVRRPESLIRQAHAILDAKGIVSLSRGRIRKIVREYCRRVAVHDVPFGQFFELALIEELAAAQPISPEVLTAAATDPDRFCGEPMRMGRNRRMAPRDADVGEAVVRRQPLTA